MTRFLYFAAFLLAALTPAHGHAQENWTGDWNGTLATPMGPLRLVLTINRDADGALTAELESVDQAPGRKIPVQTITLADGRLSFAIPAIGATYEGRWGAAAARFTGTFTQGAPIPLDLVRGRPAPTPTITGLDGRWEGSVTRNGTVLRLILRVSTGPEGTVARFDSPDLMATGLAVAGLARQGNEVRFAVPVGGSRFRGTLLDGPRRMTGTWSREGSPDVEITLVHAAAAAAAARLRPQLPRAPFPYRIEEVRIANPRAPGVTLAGTLTLPPGAGPFPAAILISGSGPQDRDETVFTHKPFAVLADHLTRAGIAVLRYDDRGFAASTGSQSGATSADFATDANAAFAFLRGRPEINGRAIGFIGHSEGGMIGPIAARDNRDLAFMVLLAGPGVPTRLLMASQARAIGESQGQDETTRERFVEIQQALYAAAGSDGDAAAALRASLTDERLRAAGLQPAQREQIAAQASAPWLRWFVRYDPAPDLARLRMPILALNGALDRQVIAGENLAGIRAATAANPDVTIRELPALNHMFQTARTGGLGEYADIEETFAPAAMEAISDWIRRRFPAR